MLTSRRFNEPDQSARHDKSVVPLADMQAMPNAAVGAPARATLAVKIEPAQLRPLAFRVFTKKVRPDPARRRIGEVS